MCVCIHNNHDHIDEGKRVKGDRGWEKGEGGRMERGGRKWGRQEIKEKRGRRERGGGGGSEIHAPCACAISYFFTSLVLIRGVTNTRITQLYSGFGPCRFWVLKCWRMPKAHDCWHSRKIHSLATPTRRHLGRQTMEKLSYLDSLGSVTWLDIWRNYP